MFSLLVKWLCAPRGRACGVGQFFLLVKWLALRAGQRRGWFFLWAASRAGGAGLVFSFGQMALRSARARGRAGFFFKLVLALVARGRFFLLVKWLALRAGQR